MIKHFFETQVKPAAEELERLLEEEKEESEDYPLWLDLN